MDPIILFRHPADLLFQKSVHPTRVDRVIASRILLPRLEYFQPITSIVRQHFANKRQHLRLTGLSKPTDRSQRAGRNAEERDESRIANSVIHIRAEPDRVFFAKPSQ